MTTTMSPVVSVEDLRRAYRAALAGEFRHPNRARPAPAKPVATEWAPGPGEQVVLVVGACGGAGASTVALGLATCAGDARVVECCTVAASGLAGASTAEMGVTADGWVQGTRDTVLIERRSDRVASIAVMPAPSATAGPLTVLDCPADVDLLVHDSGWLGALARTAAAVLVVTRGTGPGLRRLEAATSGLGADRVHAVVVGAPKRWPRPLEQALGAHGRQLRTSGRLIGVPHDPQLAVDGITTDPLPAALLAVVAPVLESLRGTFR
ncbi:MAG: hypothetical protein CVT65_14080 [Actinobacteria bacterium HGW-Actinobacteria-5]|jgi:hypothetical protein|nr:MAG: hypothetical protein CVT65_14080 [Actinobacteria bacterium HGW-Actinobacteria-5]